MNNEFLLLSGLTWRHFILMKKMICLSQSDATSQPLCNNITHPENRQGALKYSGKHLVFFASQISVLLLLVSNPPCYQLALKDYSYVQIIVYAVNKVCTHIACNKSWIKFKLLAISQNMECVCHTYKYKPMYTSQ